MSDTLSWKPPDYSDAGNAVVLVNECHGLLAFCDALGWLSWAGTHWEQNEHQAMGRAVKLTENMIIEAGIDLNNALQEKAAAEQAVSRQEEGAGERLERAKNAVKRAGEYFNHAKKSRNLPRIKGMLELSKPTLHIAADRLDADPFALNTPAGIVDLQTGEITPHDIDAPFKWNTRITNASPGDQGAAVWTEFLQTITCGDDSLVGFLQQVPVWPQSGKCSTRGSSQQTAEAATAKAPFSTRSMAFWGPMRAPLIPMC